MDDRSHEDPAQSGEPQVPPPPPIPEALRGPATEQQPHPVQEQPPKKRGCRRFAIGCLIVVLVIAIALAAVAAWLFRWPQQLGLVDSPAEQLFEVSPNPWAAEEYESEFTDLGHSLEGLTFYVLPQDDGTHIAYVLANEAEGFSWQHPAFENPLEGLLINTAGAGTTVRYDVTRVAVDYRDTSGSQVAVVTAPTDALIAFALGEISQAELFDQMNGTAPDRSVIEIGGGE